MEKRLRLQNILFFETHRPLCICCERLMDKSSEICATAQQSMEANCSQMQFTVQFVFTFDFICTFNNAFLMLA